MKILLKLKNAKPMVIEASEIGHIRERWISGETIDTITVTSMTDSVINGYPFIKTNTHRLENAIDKQSYLEINSVLSVNRQPIKITSVSHSKRIITINYISLNTPNEDKTKENSVSKGRVGSILSRLLPKPRFRVFLFAIGKLKKGILG